MAPWKNGFRQVEGVWHYRFMFAGRIFHGSTGCRAFRDALAYRNRLKGQLALGKLGLVTPPSLQDAFQQWQEAKAGKLSAAHLARAESAFRLHVLPIAGQLRCDQVQEVLEDIRTRYLAGASLRTGGGTRSVPGVNTLVGYIRAVLMHQGVHLEADPLRAQEPVRQWVALHQVDPFLAAVDRTGNLHQSVAVRAMLYLGLRESEALGMRWEWFGADLTEYTPGKTKGKEAWPLPVAPQLRTWVLKCGRQLAGGLVLPWHDADGVACQHAPQFTRKAILRGAAAIKVPSLSPHSLRRTAATLMARAGVDVKVIQRMLRHKDVRTTMRYIQAGLADLQDAVKKLWGTS